MDISGRVMALDIGDARIGVALSDPLRLTGQPHSTIERNKEDAVAEILKIAANYSVTDVVLGMPTELDGRLGTQAQKVLIFKRQLEEAAIACEMPLCISTLDERFTTEEAKRVVVGSKLKNRAQRAALDRVSAAIILSSFLDRLLNSSK